MIHLAIVFADFCFLWRSKFGHDAAYAQHFPPRPVLTEGAPFGSHVSFRQRASSQWLMVIRFRGKAIQKMGKREQIISIMGISIEQKKEINILKTYSNPR